MDPLGVAQGGGGTPSRPDFSVERAVRKSPEPSEAGSEESPSGAEPSSEVKDQHGVGYAVDDKTGRVVTRVVDRKSGEVVREFPPKELRQLQQALKEASEHLFDRIA